MEKHTIEFTITNPDPALIELLTGQKIENTFSAQRPFAEGGYALDVYAPIKRTFWQWLRRKPRQYRHIYFPHVTHWEG